MKCKVYYTSSRNVAKVIAQALAQKAGVYAEPLNPAYMPDGVELMFLGCDGSRIDSVVLSFIESLRPERVRYAALFNTNSKLSSRGIETMKDELQARGIRVLENSFICLSRPFQKAVSDFDLDTARDFALASIREVQRHLTK